MLALSATSWSAYDKGDRHMIAHPIRIRRKGQMTLPAEVREDLNLDDGDTIYLRKVNGRYTVFTTESWVERTAGIFADYAEKVPPLGPEEMDRVVEDAVIEDWNRFVREMEEEYDK